MQITIDTNETLTEADRRFLRSLLGGDDGAELTADKPPEPESLQDTALARAAEMLAAGGAAKKRVMEALVDSGAEKVSLIPEDKLTDFLAALEG